ncbi:MAG: hypothetical protein EHM64_00270 [Ignavibacteriae bacterium]|nr:MAG: hypothetical protein EHM64_00270 [Ignavibacteriota bacterium]
MNSRHCIVKYCVNSSVAHGLCWKHYKRKKRNGSVEFVKRRYNMPHKCRYCGTTDARSFYQFYKSVCKMCRKLKAVQGF